MRALRKLNLVQPIKQKVLEQKTPILGICLGMQMLADTSFENGRHTGLGLIAGEVVKLRSNDNRFRIPNIGWCDVFPQKASSLFNQSESVKSFYHIHSYHLECKNPEDVAASIRYAGTQITVSVEKDNVFGVSISPRKK